MSSYVKVPPHGGKVIEKHISSVALIYRIKTKSFFGRRILAISFKARTIESLRCKDSIISIQSKIQVVSL